VDFRTLRETQLDDRVHDVAQARHIQRARAELAQYAASTPHVAADHGLAEGETRCGLTGGDKLLVATLEAIFEPVVRSRDAHVMAPEPGVPGRYAPGGPRSGPAASP